MQIYFLTCNLLVCYIFYDDQLLFLLLEQLSYDLLWLHTFKTKVMFTRQCTDFNRSIFSFYYLELRKPRDQFYKTFTSVIYKCSHWYITPLVFYTCKSFNL